LHEKLETNFNTLGLPSGRVDEGIQAIVDKKRF
jgi:hypothetical protein